MHTKGKTNILVSRINIYLDPYTLVCVYVCMYVCVSVFVYVYVCKCVCMYVRKHIKYSVHDMSWVQGEMLYIVITRT